MSDLIAQAKKDTDNLQKLANTSTPQGSQLKTFLSMLAPFMLTAGVSGIAGYRAGKEAEKHVEEEAEKLKNSFHTTFAKSDTFKKDPALYSQRFSELALISPTVAKNPNFAHKIIESNLKSGFDVDDIHKLSAIEFQKTNTRSQILPAQAIAAARMNAADKLISIFGGNMLHHISTKANELKDLSAKEYKEHLQAEQAAANPEVKYKFKTKPTDEQMTQDVNDVFAEHLAEMGLKSGKKPAPKHESKKGFNWFKKEGSMNLVSDECLGQMLAERHEMLKTAGVWDSMKKNLAPGTEAMGKYLAFMAPSLLIGGGAALVQNVVAGQKDKKIADEAERVYLGVAKNSDTIKQDASAAREAFTTMKLFAPTLATRPMLVKTFVEHTLMNNHMSPQSIKELAEAESAANRKGGAGFLKSFKENVELVGKPSTDFTSKFEASKEEHAKRTKSFAERDKL